MKPIDRFAAIAFTAVLILSGCASMPASAPIDMRDVDAGYVSKATMIPIASPRPIETIGVYDASLHKRVESDVLSLDSSQIRDRLTSTETFITVEKADSSGSLKYLGAGGKVGKGRYRVTFDYVNFTDQPVVFNGGNSALGRIGVGLRIIADLETSGADVDLSGLIPIGLAAQQNKVSGQLRFRVYGISNDKIALAVPSQSILDVSSIQKSFEAAAAVRILFGLKETRLEPYLIGVSEVEPGDADKALKAATEQLVK